MARKTYTAEQIIGMLREAEVRLAKGEKVGAIEGTRERECAASQGGLEPDAGCPGLERSDRGKVLSRSRRRAGVAHGCTALGVSERRACRVVGQHRSTQRKPARPRSDEKRLTADIVRLASDYDRYV